MTQLRRIEILGTVDANNSSSTPLAEDATFTGTATETLDYGILFVSVYSDVGSAEDGLKIEQSVDGTNWDFSDLFTIAASSGKTFSVNPHAKYFRIRYVNGAIAQSVFRLQAILKGNSKPTSHRLRDDVITDDDAELVTSVLKVATNDDITFKNVDVQNPLPTDGDSVYGKDLDLSRTVTTGWTGDVTDLFGPLLDGMSNSSGTNPKTLTVYFRRAVITSAIGLGTGSGSFSNTKIYGVATAYEVLLYDGSSDNTDRTILQVQFEPSGFTGIRIEFHTADACTLTNISVLKMHFVLSTIRALGDSGETVSIKATRKGNLKFSLQEYGDTPAIDAFDRLRVSEPFTLFDSKQLHDKQPLFWDESLGGSATSAHSSTNACVEMVVTASASDFVIRQTKQRFNYQPGKSQLILLTFTNPVVSGVTSRMGLFDGTGVNYLTPNNGIFFQSDGTNLSWNIAKNGSVVETVNQSAWNVDKLDGTGDSGITLDMSASQIAIIDYEWLGVGRVRVGFVIDGIVRYCHYFNHANDNTFDSVYMSSPNLPLRYDIQSDGSNPAQLDHICSTVISEGGVELTGILRSVDNGITHVDANVVGTTYALLGIRLKSTYSDITILPQSVSVLSKTSTAFKWALILNPTVAGVFTYSDVTNSAVQLATGATTNTVTNGLVLASGYVSDSDKAGSATTEELKTSLRLGASIAGVADTLVLCVIPLDANADVLGSISFREML